MKQAQNARKQRGRAAKGKGGRSNNNSSGGGNRTDNRPRGNPKQLLEKYKTQARDALQSGDRVTAEYYLQFADHYQRVLNEMQANREQNSDASDDNKQRRTRRGRQNRQEEDVAVDASEQTPAPDAEATPEATEEKTDPADAEQPVEVHPELDLGSGVEEKPKRRAPVRKRRAPKPKASAEEPKATPEGDAAA